MLERQRDRFYVARHRLQARWVEGWRSLDELGPSGLLQFRRDRAGAAYQAVFDKAEPLVSICIPTYNKGRLLIERAVASSLTQTYRNIEIIVVGDCCTDETADLMRQVDDPRVRWLNLPERGAYPTNPEHFWLVAGYIPFNKAMQMAQGDFITHLDHDDEHSPDRTEKLVRLIQQTRADFVYHPFEYETEAGDWLVNPADHFEWGKITTSSVLYHKWFRRLEGSLLPCKYLEPGDWARFRKIRFLGARRARHPDLMLRHYKEGSMKSAPVGS